MSTQRFHGTCRHCGVKKVGRPRGLCWGCYRRPGVKERYPSTSEFARRSEIPDFNGSAKMPKCGTAALPGPEKVADLEERARRGQSLFDPRDVEADLS